MTVTRGPPLDEERGAYPLGEAPQYKWAGIVANPYKRELEEFDSQAIGWILVWVSNRRSPARRGFCCEEKMVSSPS